VSGGDGGSGIVVFRTIVPSGWSASATGGNVTVTTDGSYNVWTCTGNGTIKFSYA
jgi:hypothetical protein